MVKFTWRCPQCKTQQTGTTRCHSCQFVPNLSEQVCIHGHGFDMACDECGRSGFRFEEVNDGDDETGAEPFTNSVIDALPVDDQPYLPLGLIEEQLADEGSMDGPGFRCDRLKGKTMTEEEWRNIHDEHKGFLRTEYTKAYNEVQPLSYRLYKLICPGCGASLQCMEELEGVD